MTGQLNGMGSIGFNESESSRLLDCIRLYWIEWIGFDPRAATGGRPYDDRRLSSGFLPVSGLRFEFLSTSRLFLRRKTLPESSDVRSLVVALSLTKHMTDSGGVPSAHFRLVFARS